MKYLCFLLALATVAWAGDQWPARIPDKLALCYTNRTISNRYRRMPHSIDNLIALIRKVEAHPDAQLWTAGKLAGTLIKRFRYDGIVDLPNTQPDVVPVVAEKRESDKFRLQWQLVPGAASQFPESALTLEEQCAMHWMLSYTVNHTMRSENKPPSLAGRARSLPSDEEDIDGEESHTELHHVESHDTDSETSDLSEEPPSISDDDGVEAPNDSVAGNTSAEEKVEDGKDETVDEYDQPNERAEDVEPPVPEEMEEPEVVPTTVNEDQTEDDDGGSNSDDEFSFWRKKRQASPTAEIPHDPNPLEGGIVSTRSGTVAMGPVLMGIASGSEPQTAKLGDLIKDPGLEISESSRERQVDSIWVATLAADIGQTSLLRAPQRYEAFGPKGTWNSSYCPREYKLSPTENDHSFLTNAEFYGGLDGLLMAQRIKIWDESSYLKLSAILEMYYSENGIHGDHIYRACNRLYNYKDKIDYAMLKEQSLNAALIMYAEGIEGAPSLAPNVRPVDKLGEYVNNTMREVENYLANLNNVESDFKQCKGEPTFTAETPATYTDLTFVIDQFNDASSIEKQKELVAALAYTLDIQVGGSRLELVSGKDGMPFITFEASNNKATLACNITSKAIGYSERRIADTLSKTRTRINAERANDKTNKVAGSNTRAIVFFVSTYVSQSAEKDKIKSVLAEMLREMPDVHIMFATLASPEEFRPFVQDFDRDIIRMNSFTNYADAAPVIANRLATVGARLSFPNCKDTSKTANTTETQYVFNGFLNSHTVQYFRLGSEHFYSSNVMTLRFKSEYGVARYCISNTKTTPGQGDNCKSALKAGETVEFKITQPCGKQVPPYCPSYYISATPLNVDDNVPCSDKKCHTPDQVKFTFTHDGMRCSGSIALISNLLAVIATALLSGLLGSR